MGFGDGGSLTKTKAIRMHRAARQALEAAGQIDGRISQEVWESFIVRAANVGSRTQAKNLNFRLEKLGLLKRDGEGVVLLPSTYEDINLDD